MTEDAFLQRLFTRMPAANDDVAVPPGDDCAALRLGDDRLLLIAVDQVVGDKHYVRGGPQPTAPNAVGRKLLARNLSDIAAMGGIPRHCLITVAVAPKPDQDWHDRFFDGVFGLAEQFDMDVLGGDIAAAPVDDVATLTILGDVPCAEVCLRSGAQAGDRLFATGTFGDSLGSGHHLSFTPRCAEGRWLAHGGWTRTMIDVSDGLLLDAARVCRASGVGLTLRTHAIPRRSSDTTLDHALRDGEDYELLAAVPARRAGDLLRDWPFPETPLACLGEFTDRAGVIVDENDRPLAADGGGYDHLANP